MGKTRALLKVTKLDIMNPGSKTWRAQHGDLETEATATREATAAREAATGQEQVCENRKLTRDTHKRAPLMTVHDHSLSRHVKPIKQPQKKRRRGKFFFAVAYIRITAI
jgi:hypothetical protein